MDRTGPAGAEGAQDLAEAERRLLAAARVDKTFDPRWALVNFYFRRNDQESFWRRAREAAGMAAWDPSALFRLCWRMMQDPRRILDCATPDRAGILSQHLGLLLADNRLEACGPVSGRLWNRPAGRELIEYEALAPNRGIPLTSGDFGKRPLERGFDWRMRAVQGVTVTWAKSPPALKISFSGEQPASCDRLWQLVPVVGGRKYRLRFVYRTEDLGQKSGLRWRVFDAAGAELLAGSSYLSSEGWTEGVVAFATPSTGRNAYSTGSGASSSWRWLTSVCRGRRGLKGRSCCAGRGWRWRSEG